MPRTQEYQQERLESETATIAISTTTSNAIDCRGVVLVGLIMPAAFTGTSIGILSSFDGVTYNNYYNSAGTLLTIAVGINRQIGYVPADFAGVRWFKIVSNLTEIAEREIQVILRGM